MGIGNCNFVSNSEQWSTPDSLWKPLDDEFHFELDVCASEENKKCDLFYSKENNGLTQPWDGVCWMNPPFGREMKLWVIKAYNASMNGSTVVCLLPCRTNTNWWHDYVMKGEVRFIRGCPKFGNSKRGLWMPLAIVIFRQPNK